MFRSIRYPRGLLFAAFGLALVGCATPGPGDPEYINEHFFYKFRSHGFSDNRGWTEIHSRDADGKTRRLWPVILDTRSVHTTNQLAIFVGRKSVYHTETNGEIRLVGKNALIAAKAGGSPCDISQIALKKLCDRDHYELRQVSKEAWIGGVQRNGPDLIVGIILPLTRLGSPNEITLSWQEIADYVNDTLKSGRQMKETWSGWEYFEKDYLGNPSE